jgi:hypothetical protein
MDKLESAAASGRFLVSEIKVGGLLTLSVLPFLSIGAATPRQIARHFCSNLSDKRFTPIDTSQNDDEISHISTKSNYLMPDASA